MPHLLAARVAESSTTTGTGAFTLAGALTGHRTFASALAASDTTEYAIVADDGSWEVGIGTYTTNTLTRTTVLGSSNAGSAVNFAAGNKTALITPLASTLQGKFEGTGRRITGDMSNATLSNRLAFQTSTVNGNTTISLIPNGTGNTVQFAGFTDPAMTNSAIGALYIDAAEVRLASSSVGTGSAPPITMRIGATEWFRLATDGLTQMKGDVEFLKAIKETVFTITDGTSVDINPSNGTIQLWTLGASRTPTATNFLAGESVLLMIDDGASAFSVTWTTIGVVWETDGGTAPVLATSGYTPVVLWKTGTTVYGARIGNA